MLKHHIIYSSYTGWMFDFGHAEGSHVWTQQEGGERRKLIDFTSGWNTTNLGWNHPEVAEAMVAQVRKNVYAPMWTADASQAEYARGLTAALPAGLDAVGRATGGTEANEMAIKTARAFTGRRKIIGFQETYHGQSAATLAIGFPQSAFGAITAGGADVVQLPYPQTYRTPQTPEQVLERFAGELEKALAGQDVAAVVTEAGIVTGWGSTAVAPKGYLPLVRKLTQQHGTLMILDEVGTGFSRCGSLFGLGLEGVTPDIVTFAKAITNGGAAMGAMVTRQDIAEATFEKSILISTFGWTPVACAAAVKTLQIHQRDKVWEKAQRDGKHTVDRLRGELADHPKVGDIRGVGMEIGIDIVKDKASKEKDAAAVAKVAGGAFERGLHVACDYQSNIQLMPPLTIDRAVLDEGLGMLIESIRGVR